jgi:hypothetical protein
VEPFGRHRQLVLTGGLGFISDSSTTTSFSITPAADYFVANNFSLGAGLGYNKSTYTQNFSSNTYSSTFVTLRIAWNIPIGPRTSIWPMASPKYATANAAPDVASINVEVPLLIHIVPHFFLAVGPFLSIDHQIADSSSGYPGDTRTSRGIDTFIGGWW